MSLKEARVVFGQLTNRRPPCYQTVRSWSDAGLRGVVLECRWIGGAKYTTLSAIARFVDQLSAVRQNRPLPGNVNNKSAESARDRLLQMLAH